MRVVTLILVELTGLLLELSEQSFLLLIVHIFIVILSVAPLKLPDQIIFVLLIIIQIIELMLISLTWMIESLLIIEATELIIAFLVEIVAIWVIEI